MNNYRLAFIGLLTIFVMPLHAQIRDTTSQKAYLQDLQATAKTFSRQFRQHYTANYSLPDSALIRKIDSARTLLYGVLNRYRQHLDPLFVGEQEAELNYYLDKFLADYPEQHTAFTGDAYSVSGSITQKLSHNLPDFNKPSLLANEDFTNYARVFFALQITQELKKKAYNNKDNRMLGATFRILPKLISNQTCLEFWQYDYLRNHIDNNGIKNIETIYHRYLATSKDTSHLRKLKAFYDEDQAGRKDHQIKVYKKIGPYQLDMHLFLPIDTFTKHPVMIYFHGGSWSQGKPDWFFDACRSLAKAGWVACAVEYRIYERQGTLPFEAVKDARSAIRWLRQHATNYRIDTSRIVASGNSAGGHLVLCSALANNWNEKTDDQSYNPVPNVLMVTSGVYDLTDQKTEFFRRTINDKTIFNSISPNSLVRKKTPPMLLIHATGDGNVPFESAKQFAAAIQQADNLIEFQVINGNNHFLWFDPKYADQVGQIRKTFLLKLGYIQ